MLGRRHHEGKSILSKDECVAGVDKEIRQWPIWLELACLLPHTHLHLVMVSPNVPEHLSGKGFDLTVAATKCHATSDSGYTKHATSSTREAACAHSPQASSKPQVTQDRSDPTSGMIPGRASGAWRSGRACCRRSLNAGKTRAVHQSCMKFCLSAGSKWCILRISAVHIMQACLSVSRRSRQMIIIMFAWSIQP